MLTMYFITTILILVWLYTFYKMYQLADMVVCFKLCFWYYSKIGLTSQQRNFLRNYKGYIAFMVDYQSTMNDLESLSIEQPKNFHEAMEIFMELKEYY